VPAPNVAVDINYCAAGCVQPQVLPSVTNDSGRVVVQLPGACPGDMVSVIVKKPFGLLYPSSRRVPLSRDPDGAPLVVCEIGKCSLSNEAADQLTRKILDEVKKLERPDGEALLGDLKRQIDELQVQNQQLVAFVEKKERQIAAARQASRLLSQYENRAQELSDRFARHALRATAYPGQPDVGAISGSAKAGSGPSGPADQINAGIVAFNEVFDELRGKSDDYAKGMLGYWSNDASAEFQRLVGAALAIHDDIYRFNEVKDRINDLNRKLIAKSEVEKTKKWIGEETLEISSTVNRRLQTFHEESRGFLASLDREFLDDPTTPKRDVPGS
jgi:DNA repair exonuclease SbcCD ATPase subunit